MQSRVLLVFCSILIILLMVSSTIVIADDQYYPRARKIPGGAWLSTHQLQQIGKRGRFVFRDAPNAHHFDAIHTDDFVNDDAHDADSSLDKRNWRL